MGGFFKNLEKVMMAVTFAEAGEHETAREFLRDTDRKSIDRQTISKRPRKDYRASAPRQ